MNDVTDKATARVQALQAEIVRLNKVVDALIERAEREVDGSQSGYGMFQSTILLEDLVRSRTRELEDALQRNESISRELQVANEKSEKSEQKLSNILELAPIGMCIADMDLHYLLTNKAFCDIVGYGKEELAEMTALDITHPDDLHLSRESLNSLLAGEIDSYQIEKRYIRRNGDVVWVNVTTSLLRDSSGTPYNLIGQFQDITARVLAEEKLRLAATVYNYSNEAMMITDADNHIVATNPAFTELTGYSAEEVLGKNPNFLSSGRHGADFYHKLWHSLATTHHWEGDVWNRKKSGELYAEWLSISAVHNAKGAVQNYVALFTDVTEKKKVAEQIWEYANFDPLTRLPNRRLFRDRLEQAIKKADRAAETMALLFIDLDYFKEVNDTLGHQVGDELLVQVAHRLTAQVRASDTVARLGGDEFTAILSDINNAVDAGRIAQAFVDTLAQPFHMFGHEVHVSGSIGVILYPDEARTVEELIKGADDAMYQSKAAGRSRYTCFKAAQASIAA